MATFLDVKDFGSIVDAAEPVRRSGLACRLFADYEAGALDEREVRAALSVFRAIARDAEVAVRVRFARFAATSRRLTGDLATHMAGDVSAVAVPVITGSPVLEDDALVDLAASVDRWRQIAIAGRAKVSPAVSAALIEVGCAEACRALIANPGAALPWFGFDRLIERFPDHHELRDALLERPGAPAALVERHLTEVADRLSRFVAETGWLDQRRARLSTGNAVDEALITYASGRSPEVLRELCQRWAREGRLTNVFLIRATMCGSSGVLEHALAALGRIPVARCRMLIRDPSGYGLVTLCARMGLNADLESDLVRIVRARAEVVGRNPHVPGHDAVRKIAAIVYDPQFMRESPLSALGVAVVRDIARNRIDRDPGVRDTPPVQKAA